MADDETIVPEHEPITTGWETEKAELIETLQRIQADFENYKKRTERNVEEYRKAALVDILKELLLVIDHFELALKHAPHTSKEEMISGFQMVDAQMQTILEQHGVTRIPVDGHFNPLLHEALFAEPRDDEEKGRIIEEIQHGYRLGDKVLRTAKVKIAK